MANNPGTNYKIPRLEQPISDQNSMVTRAWYSYLGDVCTMTIVTGNGAPDVVPNEIGDEYMDLLNKKVYKAFGVRNVLDWVLIN